MKISRNFKLFALSILLAGCGSSSSLDNVVISSGSSAPTTVRALIDEAGGSLTNPVTGHAATIAPLALDDDTTVSLTLLNSDTVVPRNEAEFDPVGTGLLLEVPDGLDGTVSFVVPYPTAQPEHHRLYWQLPDGSLFPLESDYNESTGAFSGSLDLSEAELLTRALGQNSNIGEPESVAVTVVDETVFDGRPAHVPWPGYNLYQFQNGAFVKIVNQNPSGTLPDPGDHPLMLVHGLGSDANRMEAAATYLQSNGQFSNIFAFEYDTQLGLTTLGPRLASAYAALENDPASHWSHMAHSMGTLVSRVAFETGEAPPYASNSAVFVAGPHLGTTFMNALQGDLNDFQRGVRYMVINDYLNFTNADGTPCEVDIHSPGFNDLADGNSTLSTLNTGAANNHPEETYRTIGGNAAGTALKLADFLIGIYPDDGLVFLTSANPGSLIGAVKSDVVPESHTSIIESDASLSLILEDLDS